jgi:DNA-binding protein HU-beta
MKKSEIVKILQEKARLSTTVQAEEAYDALFSIIAGTLKNGEPIAISGFGRFRTVDRAARKGRNPRTGETIQIPASRTVKFVPGKRLKAIL